MVSHSDKARNMKISKTGFTQQIRELTLTKYNDVCACCGYADRAMLEFDHIIPRSKNGPHTLENCQVLCHCCNQKKGETTIAFQAKEQNWHLTMFEIMQTRNEAWIALDWKLPEQTFPKVKRIRKIHRS
jgi:5-methylcytosine-specific restriction endonuclease McrA